MKGHAKGVVKTKCNFVCALCGLIDRLFGRIHIDENGKAISGFIAGRYEAYIKNASMEIDSAQSEINNIRTFADEKISQFSESDVELLYCIPDSPNGRRKGKMVANNIASLFEVNNSVKAEYVKLHSDLDNHNAEFKRQLTAYLLAGISKNKRSTLNIEQNTTASYDTLVAYTTYLESYQYVDTYIKEFVDKIVDYSDKISKVEEVLR